MSQPLPSGIDIEFRNVVKRFGEVSAVDHVSFNIPKGSFYSFLGPSGCGKTTSLRLIGGFEQPDEGEILINGESVVGVPPYQRHVNMVFQHYALFPHMDVVSNVGYGLRQQKPRLDKTEIDRRVTDALALVRLSGYERRRSWELSGGQQQRVALARALINKPTVLLLDEPLAALDRKLRKDMQVELKTLQREVGITFVFVTHDQEEALSMSDRIAVMRDGRIVQEGSPSELYNQPADRYVAGFLGQTNFISGEAVELSEWTTLRTGKGFILRAPRSSMSAAISVRDKVVLAVRPERLSLQPGSPKGFRFEEGVIRAGGRVLQTTFLGDQTEYHVETESFGRLTIRMSSAITPANTGDEVEIFWPEHAGLALLDD